MVVNSINECYVKSINDIWTLHMMLHRKKTGGFAC